MVDITRCERCGKVIPALASGCPYCETPDRGLAEPHYMPLAIRMLLILFMANVGVTMVLAVATLMSSFGGQLSDSIIAVLATSRFLVGAFTTVAFIFREPWGRFVPVVFVAFEAFTGLSLTLGWLDAGRWAGGMLAPLWNVLFLFLFLRQDVQVRFDPSLLDRKAVDDLLSSVDGDPGASTAKRRR